MNDKMKMTLILLLFVVIGALGSYILIDISEKKFEANYPFFKVVDIGPLEDDPKVWGQNFPLQYETYLSTADQVRTRFGGSEAYPQSPTEVDPRSWVTQSKLDEDPRLVKMWQGYAFSIDYREERGHAYMLLDQIMTKRQQAAPQPGACLNCHASTYVAMMKLGQGNLQEGFSKINAMPYHEAVKNVSHPVSCIDCHDPQTMHLRITRPAFMEGVKQYKKLQGIENFEVNSMATRQEMRTFVCAQCHVEYYFKGSDKKLTYPWSKGLKGDEILEYYRENPHTDWVHPETGAKMLKAQHPEFETYSQGVHARSGVSCVDCHMPYKRVGAMKITNHHIHSPLLNVSNSCQTCHHSPDEDILNKAENIQVTHEKMRDQVLNALVEYIDALKKAKQQGIAPEVLEQLQQIHREAQFLADFVESENSWGFHAPQESARILLKALDMIRKGQILLSKNQSSF